MTPVVHVPATAAQVDLTGRGTAVIAFLAMALVSGIDLFDGRLGPIFSVGFVLIAITAPLAVVRHDLPMALFLPPLLLILSLGAVAALHPPAIQVDGMPPDIDWAGRLLTATIDHGQSLIAGYGLALAVIVGRALSASEPVS